jgi:hypothetical protein
MIGLKPLPFRRLTGQKKGFWIATLAAKLEGAEVLVPQTFRDVWLRFHPEPKLVQVVEANIAIVHTSDQVVAYRSGQR